MSGNSHGQGVAEPAQISVAERTSLGIGTYPVVVPVVFTSLSKKHGTDLAVLTVAWTAILKT